jgi:hypothetical protein
VKIQIFSVGCLIDSRSAHPPYETLVCQVLYAQRYFDLPGQDAAVLNFCKAPKENFQPGKERGRKSCHCIYTAVSVHAIISR